MKIKVGITILTLICIINIQISASEPTVNIQNSKNDIVVDEQEIMRIEMARLEGKVSSLETILETQRDIATGVLHTVQTVVTVYTGAVAVIALLLGLFGYTNLRAHIEREIKYHVQTEVENKIESIVNDRMDQKLEEWDRKFDELFRRVEKLNAKQS